MTDPIFHAAAYIEKVCAEVDHLSDAFERGLADLGFDIALRKGGIITDEGYSGLRYANNYTIRRPLPRQRKDAQLMLHFDLWRQALDSDWAYRESALMVVAYDVDFTDGWSADQLALRADGFAEDAHVRKLLGTRYDRRLQIWPRRDDPSVEPVKQAWFFALELRRIGGLVDLSRMAIDPVVALLRNEGDAHRALTSADAVQWPEQEARQMR